MIVSVYVVLTWYILRNKIELNQINTKELLIYTQCTESGSYGGIGR